MSEKRNNTNGNGSCKQLVVIKITNEKTTFSPDSNDLICKLVPQLFLKNNRTL